MILVRFTAAALAAIATLSVIDTTAVRAQTIDGDTATLKVSYKDLDMATRAGQKAFHNRIQRASRLVCEASNPGMPFNITSQCITQTREAAMLRFARQQQTVTLAAR